MEVQRGTLSPSAGQFPHTRPEEVQRDCDSCGQRGHVHNIHNFRKREIDFSFTPSVDSNNFNATRLTVSSGSTEEQEKHAGKVTVAAEQEADRSVRT